LKVDSIAGRVIKRDGSYLFVEFKMNELHGTPFPSSDIGSSLKFPLASDLLIIDNAPRSGEVAKKHDKKDWH
jgi:hypothetical protein